MVNTQVGVQMKKSERQWLQMLLDDPKLRKAWLAFLEERRQEQVAALKEHFELSVQDLSEEDEDGSNV